MYSNTREFPTTAGHINLVWPERLTSSLARLVALLTVIAAVAVVAARTSSSATDVIHAPAGSFLSLDERLAHNGRYRAEVVSAPAIAVAAPQNWTIYIARRSGRRVANARVAIRTWMPEQDSISFTNAEITYIGRGRYRVDHLRFPTAGWWNVALVIDGIDGVDSLAFNLILPEATPAPHSIP